MDGRKKGAVKGADSVGLALGEWKCFCLIIALSPLYISRCWKDVNTALHPSYRFTSRSPVRVRDPLPLH
jgi:hypothetical protein